MPIPRLIGNLLINTGHSTKDSWAIHQNSENEPILLGRSRDNGVIIIGAPSESPISRKHAMIHFEHGQPFIRNFGQNGTLLNGNYLGENSYSLPLTDNSMLVFAPDLEGLVVATYELHEPDVTVARRNGQQNEPILLGLEPEPGRSHTGVWVSLRRPELYVDGQEKQVTMEEWMFMAVLWKAQGKACSYIEIWSGLGKQGKMPDRNTLNQTKRRIVKKHKELNPYIKSVKQYGYKLEMNPSGKPIPQAP